GRLAETFPMRVEDTPCYQTFPGDGKIANYAEGTKVGYRWYNHAKLETRYPFGSGLSYTEFEYEDYDICEKSGTATVKVRNVGEYDGKEVVQVFIDGELRGFKKVFIEKGESVTVEVAITPKAGAAWRERQAAESLKVDMTTQVKALWNLPKGRGLFEEICGKFGVQATEELVNTRDCSSFVGNMLRNMVTMFDLGWTFEDLQERIDRINEANGVKP
ncbi:MAG: fibronectin type III-like domain-contianing protein, partial [Oscillospiraceae bacterium]|nr:fibronectin type III-like domain-contianing protein [Oscillospiraceae bacterium]